jgi:hypothetical protein
MKAAWYPLVIMEWKVYRRGHPAAGVKKERLWLRSYSEWQPVVVACRIVARRSRGDHHTARDRS